jgi:hypothetical protein
MIRSNPYPSLYEYYEYLLTPLSTSPNGCISNSGADTSNKSPDERETKLF